jgi:RimJ/RimL family protein N-acetyltransferase
MNRILFIKPDRIDKPVYKKTIDQNVVSFRSLIPDEDINFLYTWVHLPYSKRFWQQDISKGNLLALYKEAIANPMQHSFIGNFNAQPICQVDIYNIESDELKEHIHCHPHDCGLHLLMIPPKLSKKGWSLLMLRHFLQFYFSFPQAARLYIEPDQENNFANQLARKANFQFLKTIVLSYKVANLYVITKQQFYESNKKL